eukprot:CAMPEP_0117537162 /NCGR_PEP_ID=MMETSP0784-20121206/41823_1 /TAXON_ID=39447 /ORGANISM="" /LENGTH=174 /DNA_ID=CAMNT_0005333741 /DNA_START=215 /DNA_END=736 /DNA_ORIENTATION=-
MALVALGPEDEDSRASAAKVSKWLWPQRVISVAAVAWCTLLRGPGCHLRNGFNIPAVLTVILAWASHYHLFLQAEATDTTFWRQLGVNVALFFIGLGIYLHVQEAIGPYWFWHSLWHLLCSLGSWHILRTKAANARKVATDDIGGAATAALSRGGGPLRFTGVETAGTACSGRR